MLKPCSIETWKFPHQSGASSIIILFTLPLLMVSNEPSKIPVDGEREGETEEEKKKRKNKRKKADERVHRLQHSQTHIQRTSRTQTITLNNKQTNKKNNIPISDPSASILSKLYFSSTATSPPLFTSLASNRTVSSGTTGTSLRFGHQLHSVDDNFPAGSQLSD